MNNEVQTATEVAKVASSPLAKMTPTQKTTAIVVGSVLTVGIVAGVYFGVKAWKKRKAEKAASAEEIHE